MNQDEIAALRKDAVSDIVEQFPDLSEEDLLALRDQEDADDKPRITLLGAIDTELGDRVAAENEAAKDNATPPPEETAKQERGEEVQQPAWQKPDYNGTLTCDQAEWRNKHLTDDRLGIKGAK